LFRQRQNKPLRDGAEGDPSPLHPGAPSRPTFFSALDPSIIIAETDWPSAPASSRSINNSVNREKGFLSHGGRGSTEDFLIAQLTKKLVSTVTTANSVRDFLFD